MVVVVLQMAKLAEVQAASTASKGESKKLLQILAGGLNRHRERGALST